MSSLSLKKLVATLRGSNASIDNLREMVKPLHIKVRAEVTNNDTQRVLLTSNRKKSNFNVKLCRQCNGVVLEFPTWNILAIPSAVLPISGSTTQLTKNLNEYDVYEIRDGSMITLYWYQLRWQMASANGFDISGYKFLSNRTYSELFDESAAKHLNTKKLLPGYCYTLIFRHHELHPLLTDPETIWCICAYKIVNSDESNSHVSTYEEVADELLPCKKQQPCSITSFNELHNKNIDALSDYTWSVTNNSAPIINYGYILRSATSNVLLESTLMRRIRNYVYNVPIHVRSSCTSSSSQNSILSGSSQNSVLSGSSLNYIILRAFLHYPTKTQFIRLFPQFSTKYSELSSYMEKIVSGVIDSLRNTNAYAATIESASANNKLDIAAVKFIKLITADPSINVFDVNAQSIITDYIVDAKYTDFFYDLLFVGN